MKKLLPIIILLFSTNLFAQGNTSSGAKYGPRDFEVPGLMKINISEIELKDVPGMFDFSNYSTDVTFNITDPSGKKYCSIKKTLTDENNNFQFVCDGYKDFSLDLSGLQVSNRFFVDFDLHKMGISQRWIIIIPLRLEGEIAYLTIDTDASVMEAKTKEELDELLPEETKKKFDQVNAEWKLPSSASSTTAATEPKTSPAATTTPSEKASTETKVFSASRAGLKEAGVDTKPVTKTSFSKESMIDATHQLNEDQSIEVNLTLKRYFVPKSSMTDLDAIYTRYYMLGEVIDAKSKKVICDFGHYISDQNRLLLCRSQQGKVRVSKSFNMFVKLNFDTQQVELDFSYGSEEPNDLVTRPMGFDDQTNQKEIRTTAFDPELVKILLDRFDVSNLYDPMPIRTLPEI